MLQVNYRLLPKRKVRKKSYNTTREHSFYSYRTHHDVYLTRYEGVYVDNSFGQRLAEDGGDQIRQRPLLD